MEKALEELINKLKKFNLDRDWDKYHNPKDIMLALVGEVGELAECYRYLNEGEIERIYSDKDKKKKIEEEIADVMINLLILSYKADIDLFKAIEEKLDKNGKKYPIEKIKGLHTNPIEGIKGKDND